MEQVEQRLAHRGRLAVAGCAVQVFWQGVMFFCYPGLMAPYWQAQFSVTSAATGLVMTCMLMALGASMFFVGRIHRRVGTVPFHLVAAVATAASLLLVNHAGSIRTIYIWGLAMGLCSSLAYGPALTTVQNWYPHRKGLVTGLVNLVFGLSAAVMSPVLSAMIQARGTQFTNCFLMVMLVVCGLPAALISPMPPAQRLQAAGQAGGRCRTPAQALRTGQFWLIFGVWCFMGAAGISMVTLSVNYANSIGLSGVTALTAFNVTNGVSRVITGTLSDKVGRQPVGCVTFLMAGAAYLLLPLAGSTVPLVILVAVVGAAFGTLFTVSPPLLSDLYGLPHFGTIFGMVFVAYGFLGGTVGPTLSGVVLERTGSYVPVFLYLAVFSLLSAVLLHRVRPLPEESGT